MVALPSYQSQLINTRRAIARAELLQVIARQEQYFVANKQYATTLELLGYASGPYVIGADGGWLAEDSNKGVYRISLSAVSPKEFPQLFTVAAEPLLVQSTDTRCGSLMITSLGVKSAKGVANSGCW